MTTWVGLTEPRILTPPLVSTAVTTPLATLWPGPDQLMLELPGQAMLAANTATYPAFSVSVTVRLSTAAAAEPGTPVATTRSSLGLSLPPVSRVSSTRGTMVLATNALGGAT